MRTGIVWKCFYKCKDAQKWKVRLWKSKIMLELEYTKWGNFKNVINKAIETCKNININISDDFADVGKIVKSGATTKKLKITNYQYMLVI